MSSSGQLARTPLPHLLVYAFERKLTGTFEFLGSDQTTATILMRAGDPTKARINAPPVFLGQVLVELGYIDAALRDSSLRELTKLPSKKLHGALLIEKGAINAGQLAEGLRVQLLRKIAQIACMPPGSSFEFYADWDGLATFGAEGALADPLAAIWAAVREHPPIDHVISALDRLGHGRLRLSKGAQIERFGFTAEERRWLDLLRIKPLPLGTFFGSAEIQERLAQLIVYCLAITKQIDLIGEEESSGALPAAEPSSPMAASTGAPQSPRNEVGRMALKRQRVRTGPIEEQTSSRMKLPDRRASVPPAGPTPDVRRAEIQARAQGIDKQNYFEMLGVTPESSLDEIKNAYILLAKTWHPDRLPAALADVKDACGRVFARMSEAHQTLIDEEKRKRYLRLMKEGGETPEQQQEIQNVLSATVEFQKAEICVRKNDMAQAMTLAKRALELDPNQADYIALVAWLSSMAPGAQTPEATQDCVEKLDKALKLNARCERAYFYRAMLYKRQGRDNLALKDFKKVAELNPKNIDAQRELRLFEMRTSAPPPATKPSLFGKLFKK